MRQRVSCVRCEVAAEVEGTRTHSVVTSTTETDSAIAMTPSPCLFTRCLTALGPLASSAGAALAVRDTKRR